MVAEISNSYVGEDWGGETCISSKLHSAWGGGEKAGSKTVKGAKEDDFR